MALAHKMGGLLLLGIFGIAIASAPAEFGERRVSLPDVGTESAATVGSVIYTKVVYPTVTVQGEAGTAVLEADAPYGYTAIPKGSRLMPQVFDGQPAFVLAASAVSSLDVYFLDRDNNSTFDEMWLRVGRKPWERETFLTPVPYSLVTAERTTSVRDETFRQELLYLGISKGTLKLQYREFNKKMAREPFYQEIAYDIEKFPATVTFRSMRVEILAADNNQIRYRILSELSD